MCGAGNTTGRAGKQGIHGRLHRSFQTHQTAVGSHDMQSGIETFVFKFVTEIVKITPHAGSDISVHDGHQRALILPKFRQYFR